MFSGAGMVLWVAAIRDAKLDQFLPMLMVAPTPGALERNYLDLVRDQRGPLAQHPGDFSLWQIGKIDLISGGCEMCSPVEVLTGPAVLALVKEA